MAKPGTRPLIQRTFVRAVVTALAFAASLHAESGDGLARWRDGRWETITFANGLPSRTISAALVDRGGVRNAAIWIGARNQPAVRPYKFTGQRLEPITTTPPSEGASQRLAAPWFIESDSRGRVRIGSGIDMLDSGRWRVIEFVNLEPGPYHLEMSAMGRNGSWSSGGLAFAFSVQPSFWKTGWFVLLCGLLGCSVLLLWARARARSLRQENQRRVQEMIDYYPGAVVMLDDSMRVQLVNRYVESVLRRPKEDMIGQTPDAAFGPALARQLTGIVERAGDGDGAAPGNETVSLPGAETRVFDVRAFRLRDSGHRADAFCLFATDVTQRAAAEAASEAYRKELEAARERYQSFLAHSTESIWRLEFEPPIPMSLPEEEFLDACYERAIVAEANTAAGRNAGIVGRHYREVRDRHHLLNSEADRVWYRSGCQMRDHVTVRRDEDGRDRTFLSNIYSVIEDGALVRAWSVVREITDKRRLQEMIVGAARGVSALTGAAFFESLCEHLASALHATCAYVAARRDPSEGEVRTLAVWSHGRLRKPRNYRLKGTPCEAVLQDGKACVVPSGVNDAFPESPYLEQLGVQSYAGTPLSDAQGNTIGLIAVMFERPLEQPDLVKSTLDIFAARASAELQRTDAEEEIRRHQDQLRALAARNLNLVEQERAQMAREIHDELGQQLTAIKIGISRLRQRIQRGPASPASIVEDLSETAGLTDETARTVRKLATQLRPPGIDTLGLAAAIRWHASEVAERLGIPVDCDIEDLRAAPDLETAIFRLVQESLTNVARHARASRVQISLESSGDAILLSVTDDGRGFDTTKSTGSLGLLGMHERAIAAGGSLSVESSPGRGTKVTATLPFVPCPAAARSAAS